MWQIVRLLYAVHKLLSFLFPDYKEHVILCLTGQQNQVEKFLIQSQQSTALAAVYNRQYVCQVETSQCAATFDFIFTEPFVSVHNYYCTALAVYQPAAASSNLLLWILLIIFLLNLTLTGFVISLLVCKSLKSRNFTQNSERESWMKKRSSNLEYTTSDPTTSLQLYRPVSSRSHLQFNIIELFKQLTRRKLLFHGTNPEWRLRLASIRDENSSLTTKTLQVCRPVAEVRYQPSTRTTLEHAVASVKTVLTTTRWNVSRSSQLIIFRPNMTLDVYRRASYVLSQSCTYFNVAAQRIFPTHYCISPASSLQIISKQTTIIDLYRQASCRIMQISGIQIFYHDNQLTILVVSCRSSILSCSSLLTIFRPEMALTQFGEAARILLITSPMVHIPDYDLPKIDSRLKTILSPYGEMKQLCKTHTDSTKESMQHLSRYGNTIDPLQVRKLLNLLTPYRQSYILGYDARVLFLVPGMKLPFLSTHHHMFYWNMQITITFFPKIKDLKKFWVKIIGKKSQMAKGDIQPDSEGRETTEDHGQDKDHPEVKDMAKHHEENSQEANTDETNETTSDVEKECKEELGNKDKDGENVRKTDVEDENEVEENTEKDGDTARENDVEDEIEAKRDTEKDGEDARKTDVEDEVAVKGDTEKADGKDVRKTDVEEEVAVKGDTEKADGEDLRKADVEYEVNAKGDTEKDGEDFRKTDVEELEEVAVKGDTEKADGEDLRKADVEYEVNAKGETEKDGEDLRKTDVEEEVGVKGDTEKDGQNARKTDAEYDEVETKSFTERHGESSRKTCVEDLEESGVVRYTEKDGENSTKARVEDEARIEEDSEKNNIQESENSEVDEVAEQTKKNDDGSCSKTDANETTQDTEKEASECEAVNNEITIKFNVTVENLESNKTTLIVNDQDNGTKSQKDVKEENLQEIDKNSEHIDNQCNETTENQHDITVQTNPETPHKKRNNKRKWNIKKKLTSFGKRILNFFRRKNTVQTEEDDNTTLEQFPSWGGGIEHKKLGRLTFTNTCPIDNWLVILHYVCLQNPEINKQLEKSPLLKELEELYSQKKFNKQKYKLMKVNSINADEKGLVNYYASEVTSFVRHMDVFFKNSRTSTCDSLYCPLPKRVTWHSEPVAWTSTAVSLYDTVLEWIFEDCYSRCSQKFNRSPPADARVYRMENNETSNTVYCDGVRETSSREFPQGMPLMIPVDAELLAAQGVKLLMKDIPNDMMILDYKYELQAVTLRSEERKHFTCVFKLNGDWLYYDGCVNNGKPSPFITGIFPTSYLPGIILYVRTSSV